MRTTGGIRRVSSTGGAGARAGYVRRHPVYSGLIGVTAVGTLLTFVPSHQKPVAHVTAAPVPTVSTTPSEPPAIVHVASVPSPKPSPRPAVRHVVVTPKATPAPKPRPKPASLTCVASVSDAAPAQYSTVDVYVKVGKASVPVQVVAHYKSTDTEHDSVTGADGRADVPFRISRATVGYTVVVDVTVTGGPGCRTSFTPQ